MKTCCGFGVYVSELRLGIALLVACFSVALDRSKREKGEAHFIQRY
jgi:hypothetical protein